MKVHLGTLLVEEGLLENEDLIDALKFQKKKAQRLGKILLDRDLIEESKLMSTVARQYGFRYLEKLNFEYNPIFAQVPVEFIHKTRMVPISFKNEEVTIATLNTEEVYFMDDFRSFFKPYKVEFVISSESEVMRVIHGGFDRAIAIAKEVMGGINQDEYSDLENLSEDTLDMANEAPIIRMVNVILTQAVQERASDIHIEISEKSLDVRYRIDGILHLRLQPPRISHAGLISRIKIMANLNIAENRLPQDGRIKLKLAGKEVDIRVSTVPTQYGERVVMRLLNKSDTHYTLDSLGIYENILTRIKALINESNGIFLVTGPTGSGKSTTLYAILTECNDGVKNILTAEDPIEYEVAGIGQMQMQEKIGFTFAQALRAMLRQDPDIIMVGEIRDEETARISIQSSLTGHLVFSTLHTNDAPSAVTRLIDMGIEPYLITSSVRGVIAQRLVRKICSKCKVSYKPSSLEIKNLGILTKNLKGEKFYRGKGCEACVNTGYQGRTGIYSLMELSQNIQEGILKEEDAESLSLRAVHDKEYPTLSLLQYGAQKVLDGVTTVEEILRVT